MWPARARGQHSKCRALCQREIDGESLSLTAGPTTVPTIKTGVLGSGWPGQGGSSKLTGSSSPSAWPTRLRSHPAPCSQTGTVFTSIPSGPYKAQDRPSCELAAAEGLTSLNQNSIGSVSAGLQCPVHLPAQCVKRFCFPPC